MDEKKGVILDIPGKLVNKESSQDYSLMFWEDR